MKNKYLLKVHDFYAYRAAELKEQIIKLHQTLPREQYIQHEIVKFAARLRVATLEIIPEDPDKPEYRLRDELRKYRRYKQGLQRYRLMFTFSSKPPIILYLYINDEKHLRKHGSKSDPYEEFSKLVRNGTFSHDPADSKIQKWISQLLLKVY